MKCPVDTIKRLLRWRGDESLEIYARLNDAEWATHVQQTYTAHVDSTIAGRLATLGTIDLEAAALRLSCAGGVGTCPPPSSGAQVLGGLLALHAPGLPAHSGSPGACLAHMCISLTTCVAAC